MKYINTQSTKPTPSKVSFVTQPTIQVTSIPIEHNLTALVEWAKRQRRRGKTNKTITVLKSCGYRWSYWNRYGW